MHAYVSVRKSPDAPREASGDPAAMFRRGSANQRADRKAEKARRKAEARDRIEAMLAQRRADRETDEENRKHSFRRALQPDEPELALFKTAETMMKKFVLFTPKRLLVASTMTPSEVESIPYRSITAFSTSNFITKDVHLTVAGRSDLDLIFDSAEERDQTVAILNEYSL